MKKNKEKQAAVKVYDFTRLNEEISIGVFVESDLSKTVANYLYQHTSDIASAELARELFHKGRISMDDDMRAGMLKFIGQSALIVSVKKAVQDLLGSDTHV